MATCRMWAVGCAVMIAACSGASGERAETAAQGMSTATDTAEVRSAIDSARQRMTAAVNRQDMATMIEGLAEDYASLETPGVTVRGRAAYKATVDSMTRTTTPQDLGYEVEGTDVSGDLAVQHGRWRMTFVPKSGGDTARVTGNFMHVWRRQADGSWKLFRDISNVTPPPEPARAKR